METIVVEKLNQVNREFYSKVAPYFDETRDYAWSGWNEVIPLLKEQDDLKVLDVGCGNGRFGFFLKNNLPNFNPANYTGIDYDPELLNKAQENLPKGAFILEDLLNYDFSKPSLRAPYDLICLFGVLHHIPGYKNRLALLLSLKNLLSESGMLFFSTWEFVRMPGFSKKIVPWEKSGIDPSLIGPDDYLLSWSRGADAVRYCHYVSPSEASKLCEEAGLQTIREFVSTTKGDSYNHYFITGV
jgi:tRNA (uracil-5-)-methyltransferase TRM9